MAREVMLEPKVLRWARERAGLTDNALADRLRVQLDHVQNWEETGKLRFTQAEKLANVTHTPFGFLFLAEPPDERLPIPDFRRMADANVQRPSPDLLETIEMMQQRQAWLRDFLVEEGEPALPFVGSANRHDKPQAVAATIRKTLDVSDGWAGEVSSWSGALLVLREKIEQARIMIVINGVVGNNTHRKLDPDEFRGFALSDAYAPLIFVNGADSVAAQMFTFAHELAHLWLGADGVSNLDPLTPKPGKREPIEEFCNRVAAEFVMPEAALKEQWAEAESQAEPFQFLARHFKVSPIVAARRARDLKLISAQLDFIHSQARKTRDPSEGPISALYYCMSW